MGAYGKAYALLYLIGAVTILTSCVKDDLYDTPHPDRGAVVVTTDWSGKSAEADIPQAYTLRIGGREQNVSAATNVFDALLAPGGYGLTVYNSPEGISIDGNKATVNPVDLTGAQKIGGQVHQDGGIGILEPDSKKEMYRIVGCK